ncbi:uncharacterized protein LOC121049149 [Rosa chinensis]|uniref:uncharacterized protein LOC121049149 n=1 Tax=Rosa chinensis TaxID=74649 RepID=UPI001AD90847|nr:uncharacterized protein LOC121049149 [Rosa chinensis]
MEENLNTFMFGKSKEEVKQVQEKMMIQKQRERFPEKQLESNRSFMKQGGRLFFNLGRTLKEAYQSGCENCEEAEQIASHGKLPLLGQPEVLLFEWAQGLTNNLKKVVSYGGWIAVKGLPLQWWSQKYFKQIGDTCGGLLEVDNRTEGFKHLFEARIRVRENEIGFLPELVKLTEGNQSHIVRIQSILPARQPAKARRKELQFHFHCKKKLTEAAGDSIFEDEDNRNIAGQFCVGNFPASSRLPEADSPITDMTRGSPQNIEKQKVPEGFNENTWEAAKISWENEEPSLDVERVDTENNTQLSMPGALITGGAQFLKKSINEGSMSMGQVGPTSLLDSNLNFNILHQLFPGFKKAPLEPEGLEAQGEVNAVACKQGSFSGKRGTHKSHSEDRGK